MHVGYRIKPWITQKVMYSLVSLPSPDTLDLLLAVEICKKKGR